MITNYTVEVQRMFLEFMLSDATSFARVQNIFNPDNFDKSLRSSANFIKEYVDKYKALPTCDQLNASEGKSLKPIPEITASFVDWFMSEFEQFTRRREVERAILGSADLIEKEGYDYGPIEALIKKAVQISLTRDLGLNYFENPKERLQQIRQNNGEMSTGWSELDLKLFGGWIRGTVNIVAGQSGAGKSLFLQNWAINLIENGFRGAYIILELSEQLCAMRLDAMITGQGTRDLFKNLDDTELKVKIFGKKSGELQIKRMPAQSPVNALRAYLRELQISTGQKLDFICVDYLDLLMPSTVKVNPSDLFTKDKYVTEELRNLADELNVVCLTASQLNRGSVDEIEFNHSHISGGISKIMTADNVFGIFTSRAMRERGKYQLQLLKTRSSSGVGQHVDLDFNVDSLRITNNPDGPAGGVSPNSMLSHIKARSTVTEIADESGSVATVSAIQPQVSADVQSKQLKSMLAGLKSSNK